jgi:hypothetical protein
MQVKEKKKLAVTGEVVITPKSGADFKDLGIEVKVKGATVKKDLFGMETWGKAPARNPDLSSFGPIAYGEPGEGGGAAGARSRWLMDF